MSRRRFAHTAKIAKKREFPDADRRQSVQRVRSWAFSLGRRVGSGPAPAPADARLDQLERLGRMRDLGLLDGSEYTTEKAKVLANTSPPG